MKWSYRLFRVAGIDVRVHATFLLLLAFYAMASSSVADAVQQIVLVLLLFLCVLLHEFGHAFAARAFGIQTPDITLLPIGGVARLARMPENPVQELVIAIAGPMVNVLIVLVLWPFLGLPPLFSDPPRPESLTGAILGKLWWVNKMLIAFNLIPAFPMDGGRVLRSLLAMRLDYVRATVIAAKVGQGLAAVFVFAGIAGIPGLVKPDLFLVFIAMFVFMGAKQEEEYAKVRAAIGGLRVSDAMVTRFDSFFGDMSIAEAAAQAGALTQPIFPVTDAHLRLTGMIPRNELLAHDAADPQAPVSTIAADIPSVDRDAPFELAFQAIHESGSPVLPVVNADRQVVGLVSLHLLTERLRGARAV